ncbi:hypothetical protein ACJZ2D_008382 [Fusarium nematophilum]
MVDLKRFALTALTLGGTVSARRKGECHRTVKPQTSCAPSIPSESASISTEVKPVVTRTATGLSGFKPGVQWEICIHHPIKHDSAEDFIPSEATVWDIDLGHAREFPDMIPTLKSAGKFVICYFNAGAVQDWDEDKDKFPNEKARLDIAAEVGCDAVDPDNVDAWQQDGNDDPSGFKLKPSDYTNYLKNLAEYAHSVKTKDGNPLLVGQKNAPEIADDLVSSLDFAVLESCRGNSDPNEESWPFCSDFQTYIDAGKPVLQIEYPPSVEKSGSLSSSDENYYCSPKDEDKGFSKIIKWASAQLDGWGQYCGEEPFRTPEAEYE